MVTYSWRLQTCLAPLTCRRQAEALFLEVCELEREFWQMAFTATAFE